MSVNSSDSFPTVVGTLALFKHLLSDFQDYADLCYKEFGDRVKHWITLNEPHSFSNDGYGTGKLAPGRCSKSCGNCTTGNSAIEPYITAHNQLLAHAAAVKVYKEKYQVDQNGRIGITLVSKWMVPFSETKEDIDAAERAIEFMFGWHVFLKRNIYYLDARFMDPLTYGKYPKSMQSTCEHRLPRFTKEQSNMVKGSYDFLGLNYYTANYAANVPSSKDVQPSYSTDSRCNLTTAKSGVSIGMKAASDWLFVYPKGILDLLLYIKKRYQNPTIYITENGVDEANNNVLPLEEALADYTRIDYYYEHLMFVQRAINEGVDLRGYFAWSLLDNFEWADGYTVRFGINYVDLNTMKRYPKQSAIWFKNFLRN